MSWHYQVRRVVAGNNTTHYYWYDIIEMYDDPIGWTMDAVHPGGATLEALRKDLQLMLEAIDNYPVFEEPVDEKTTRN